MSSNMTENTIAETLLKGSNGAKPSAGSDDLIIMTPYPVARGHTLITISRLESHRWRPEMKSNAAHIAEGDNAGIVINKPASIMDYNKAQASQKERLQPPTAKMSFKVFMMNSGTGELSLEHRTLRFWLDLTYVPSSSLRDPINENNNNNYPSPINANHSDHRETHKSTRTFANIKQESSRLAQSYFRQLLGSKPDDDFPKNYVAFIMKLMRLLKNDQFSKVAKMEVELRQLPHEDHAKPSIRGYSIDGGQPTESCLSATSGSGSGTNSGRGSPLTSQKVLDIIEGSYPNPISIRDICNNTQSDEQLVRQFLSELTNKEKINTTDDGQHYTRTTEPTSDTKIQLVKQMPRVIKSKQPVIAIITSQYCEKLAVDAMISDKETFVRYRTTASSSNTTTTSATANTNTNTTNSYTSSQNNGSTDTMATFATTGSSDLSSANYVYTLGNIGDHRVVSTKLTSIGNSRGALIAAGNATTRLLGTFPEIEYVFLVGCGGGVVNYTDFASHVRLGDVVISHLAAQDSEPTISLSDTNQQQQQHQQQQAQSSKSTTNDYVYVHCKAKSRPDSSSAAGSSRSGGANLPVSYSIHNNLKRAGASNGTSSSATNSIKDARWFEQQQLIQKQQLEASGDNQPTTTSTSTSTSSELAADIANKSAPVNKPLEYEECHFRLWRPASLDLQELSMRLWTQGLDTHKYRIWAYYIEQGIKLLKQQDIDASRPKPDTDKLYMSIGHKDTIEVNHPEAADDEIDLRREGQPMCHFGPIGSGLPAAANESVRQRMISEFGLRAFDCEFDPVVESIYGNCKESYIIIRGISDYKDGRKRKEWQQYSALVAAAFMKSIIVNLKPL